MTYEQYFPPFLAPCCSSWDSWSSARLRRSARWSTLPLGRVPANRSRRGSSTGPFPRWSFKTFSTPSAGVAVIGVRRPGLRFYARFVWKETWIRYCMKYVTSCLIVWNMLLHINEHVFVWASWTLHDLTDAWMSPLWWRSVSSSSKLGLDLSWEFFQEKFETIKGMLAKASPSLMDAVIISCCGGFTDEGKMKEVTVGVVMFL